MAYGVLPSGFAAKPFEVIKAELEAALQATFGPGVPVSVPETAIAQFIGIEAERLAELWQLAEAVYNASTPDGAADVNLDNVCAITGTLRKAPTLTKVLVTVSGASATLLPAGRVISVAGTGIKFQTVSAVTIPGPGFLAGVECVALNPGPLPAYSGTLTVIETPVGGWTSVTNPADHYQLGSDLESDAALRVRREDELRAQGSAAVEALRQAVLAVEGVTDVFVFENDTDLTNGDGLPPHSVEVVANGGNDVDVAKAIYAAKSAGVATFGSSDETFNDSQGFSKTINFSRPTLLNIWVIVNVDRDTATFPSDGSDQIKQRLVDYANANLRVGSDVYSSALGAQVFVISGVIDVPLPLIGTSNPPTLPNTIVTTQRQLAKLDTARITVNLS